MERIDEILIRLKEFAEHSESDTIISIRKNDVIRLVNYIDKLEDKEMLLNILINKNIEININK